MTDTRPSPLLKKRAAVHFEHIEKTCCICAKIFHVVYSQRHATKCSQKCHFQSMKKRIVKNCPICGTQFESLPHKGRKTCSKRCGAYLLKGGNNYRWKLDREKTCPNCGKQYEAVSSWRRENMFCSRACLGDHYRKNGGPNSKPLGSRYKDEHGYWIIKVATRSWRPEHIIVAEKEIGRKLRRNELVHHRNGDKGNNHPDNLKVMEKSSHARLHQRAEWFGLSILAQRAALPIMAGEWIHPIEGCEV